ncbi:MAG: SDR family oxidoreductase [Pirellulaceae bacterium]|jgi:gluconate 5-dehydrogenase|nr:SDR family oxidoreductase [Pirellulaceae bacterium]
MTTNSEPTIQELFDLTGRAAMVTGASGWLGGAFARALAEAGAGVVITSREQARAEDAAAKLPSPGGAVHHGVQLDQTDPKSIDRGFADAVQIVGKLDILVNNGLDPVGHDLTDCTFEEFGRHQLNTAAYFIMARHLCEHAVSRGGSGSVIMLGSMYGQVASYPDAYEGIGTASSVAYHAHKGGTIQITRHLAAYYARHNVRVNCISPGPFPSDGASRAMVERLSTKLPAQRMGRPYELKGTLLLLASDAGSFITGQNITVDGGWMVW